MFSVKGIPLADRGYYVNLDSSTERKALVEEQIKKFDIIDLDRFPALTDPLHQSSATKSQRAVFEEAEKNNFETIFVAEDDFFIPDTVPHYPNLKQKTFEEHLKDVAEDLKTLNWDVYMFGCTPRSFLIPFTKNSALIDRSTGAWAYLIKKHAWRFILENFSYGRDYQAIDNILPLLNFNNFRVFTSLPLLIHHSKGLVSTLQPGLGPVDYTHLIEGYYGKFLLDGVLPDEDYVGKHSVEREVTIVFLDSMYERFVDIMRKTLFNLPNSVSKCRILMYYIDSYDHKTQELISYFRDRPDFYNVHIELFKDMDCLISRIAQIAQTPYVLLINPKHIFTNKEIDFNNIIKNVKDNNIDALVFNNDDQSIEFFDKFDNLNNLTSIPNTISLIKTEFLKINPTANLFDNTLVEGKIIKNLDYKVGYQNTTQNKCVADTKTDEYILNNPFKDYY